MTLLNESFELLGQMPYSFIKGIDESSAVEMMRHELEEIDLGEELGAIYHQGFHIASEGRMVASITDPCGGGYNGDGTLGP
jgi:hypothetical protein